MLSAQSLKKVIVVSAAAVGLTMPLTACVAGGPAASEAKMAERTLTVAGSAGACDHVDAPMLDIPTASDAEPRMRIPQPPGWEPDAELGDVEVTRFVMVYGDPAAYPRKIAAVALERVPNADAQTIFDDTRADLVELFAERGWPTEMTTTSHTVCGLPAETVTYAGAPDLNAHPTTMLWVTAKAGGHTYLAVVTQGYEPDNPGYHRGAETILSGFQVLSPTAGQRV